MFIYWIYKLHLGKISPAVIVVVGVARFLLNSSLPGFCRTKIRSLALNETEFLIPVYTIQPVVKPVDNRLYNRFDNRLYSVNKHPTGLIQPVVKPVIKAV